MSIITNINAFFVRLMPPFLIHLFASPYLGGNSLEEGIQTAKKIYETNGLYSTMDLLGEDLEDAEEVEHAVELYKDLIKRVSEENMQQYTTISVKPSSLGLLVSKTYYFTSLEKVLKKAQEKAIKITIDMEDHKFTDPTLESYEKFKPMYPTLGTVLQTRLHRTKNDIEQMNVDNARIRLCIGIYKEPKDIALTHKPSMKERMIDQAQLLITKGYYVGFATHDEKLIKKMMEISEKKRYTPEQIEYQMLLGVPRKKIQQIIMEKGFIMRLYVPFAERKKNATAYLKRRLTANPLMAIDIFKNLFRKIFFRNK